MNDEQIIRIDGIKWVIEYGNPTPLCPDHNLRMTPYPEGMVEVATYGVTRNMLPDEASKVKCAEGPHYFPIPRSFAEEKKYVIDRIDAKEFKDMEVVDLDGELTPIAKERIASEDGRYFVTTQLMESKRGLQVVVYAGEKGKTEKTQIFVEPEIKRLAFDQKNLHPNDVFVKLKATFDDGSSHTMTNKAKEDNK